MKPQTDGSPADSVTRWSDQALEALWLIAAVAVPVIFNPWGANAFELPKVLLLRTLVLLMGLAAVIRLGENGGSLSRSARWLIWPALAFGLAETAATLFSVTPRVSLWGSYDRQQGLLTLGAYLALFLFTALGLRTRAQAERLWIVLVGGSAPIVIYGLLQALGLDPLEWRTDAAAPVLSTIGRSNFFGSYLVLLIPLTAGRLWLIRRRWPIALLLIGQLLCLTLTEARGAWIGVSVGLLAFTSVWALNTRNKRLLAISVLIALLALGVVILINLSGGPLAPLAQLPGLNRLAELSHTSEGSTAARLTIWQATVPLIATRPWSGYGPETMRVVFAQVFPPQLIYYQGRHMIVDRAHNLWLDLLMTAGLAGLIAFVALLAGFVWLAWRGLRGAADRWDQARWAAVIGAVVGHLIDLQFGFDLTGSATIFWLMLALATFPTSMYPIDTKRKRDTPGKLGWLPYVPPAVIIFALIGLLCVRPLLADNAYFNSQDGALSLQARQTEAERAVNLWPLEPEYHARLAEIYQRGGNWIAAEDQLVVTDQLSPNDPQVWMARGNLYAYWGSIEPRRFIQAETAYRRALELAPHIATYHTALGLVLAQQGRWSAGLAELERAVALDATDGTAYRHLADLYLAMGREAEATEARKEAGRWNNQ